MYICGLYVWNTGALQVTGITDNITPHFRPAAHTSDVKAGKIVDENIVEVFVVSVQEDLHGKKVSVISPNTRKKNREEI